MKSIFLFIVVLLILFACHRESNLIIDKQSLSNKSTEIIKDTIVYKGSTHNKQTYIENNDVIASISFLEDSKVLCKLTSKKDNVIIYSPLYVPSIRCKVHIENTKGKKYIAHGASGGFTKQESLEQWETAEGIYDLKFEFKAGDLLYSRGDDFFMNNGKYKVQIEFIYYEKNIDGEYTTKYITTPPLIYHHTVNQEFKKGIDDLIKKYGESENKGDKN